MRILAIRGENLASLEAPFDIDFTAEPLESAGIFAITGPTGAGKSTLVKQLRLMHGAALPLHQVSNKTRAKRDGTGTVRHDGAAWADQFRRENHRHGRRAFSQ